MRYWRKRRALSQLELSLQAKVSTRHLSCVETGRAEPSRELLLALARALRVPQHERSALLAAAGFPPRPVGVSLDAPDLAGMRRAVEIVLRQSEPFPAFVLDHRWEIVMVNAMVVPLELAVGESMLSLITTVTTVRTRADQALAELHVESLLPAVDATEQRLRALARHRGDGFLIEEDVLMLERARILSLVVLLIGCGDGSGPGVVTSGTRRIAVDGSSVTYEAHGAGDAVLLVHGAFGHGRFWEAQTEALRERYRVIAPDLPGHGASDAPMIDYSRDLMIRALARILDEEE